MISNGERNQSVNIHIWLDPIVLVKKKLGLIIDDIIKSIKPMKLKKK